MARPKLRPDGIPTRCDRLLMSTAELAICQAMEQVEKAGGSLALTDAVVLLGKARDRVADHEEGEGNKPADTRETVSHGKRRSGAAARAASLKSWRTRRRMAKARKK